MLNEDLSVDNLSRRIASLIGPVQQSFRAEKGEHYDERLIEDALRSCVARKLDHIEEDMLDMFTSPSRVEFHELAHLLMQHGSAASQAVAVEEMAATAKEFGDETVFVGMRPFSKAKLTAMVEYLVGHGQNVYRTTLNKLLFYSDLTNFYLSGHGISGAMYRNRPYGPVPDPAASLVDELIGNGVIAVHPKTKALTPSNPANANVLSDEETRVLDWVTTSYGDLSASEISDVSHQEMAYRYTQPNEPIAYAYSKFFKRLPPESLIGK
ncbi:MAG TPA: Panacea domain-containing protein [Pyrinomonadaceae bacterium]|nr:Panacea domain-containing protein [Pyrinomonadaceae bacterium]